jgi:hypothetical protein
MERYTGVFGEDHKRLGGLAVVLGESGMSDAEHQVC